MRACTSAQLRDEAFEVVLPKVAQGILNVSNIRVIRQIIAVYRRFAIRVGCSPRRTDIRWPVG